MITRAEQNKSIPINIVGSSTFGRYPKISQERTYNMFESDSFMVPYAGYKIAISSTLFGNGREGRAIFTSAKFNQMVVVVDNRVYFVNIEFNQQNETFVYNAPILLGNLFTFSGVVYITENNKPQICISDNESIYIYDPTMSPTFKAISTNFTPGYITFHDTYFIAAASHDLQYTPPANNTWRLSAQSDGTSWPDESPNIGLLQTKPDNTQAVVRFPSKGNLIFVMGKNVTEAWFDTGAQLFPYQRTNQFNIDYGCLSPATVAYMDEFVVWLAANEKSGPVILYSDGGNANKVTTDGIDYLFSTLTAPEDSQAFLYRQDGHLFYHINFYTDNISLFIDFLPDGSKKIYHASDQALNYFIGSEVAFFNNQYYFISKNDGNLFAFDTVFTTYEDVDKDGNVLQHIIPRIRICKNIRLPSQEYFTATDIGFTIESGETNYYKQNDGPLFLGTENGNFIGTEDGNYLITEQDNILQTVPHVDLSISTNGGASFGNEWAYELPPIGIRKNRLMWWQLGTANDLVPQFKFWGIGRFVVTDGVINIR